VRFALSSLVLVVVLPAGAARAADAPASNFEAMPLAVYLQAGLGTPIGALGVEVEGTIARDLALSAGVGLGFAGPQLAAMPRLQFPASKHVAVVLGAGVSNGEYEWQRLTWCPLSQCQATIKRGKVTWGNVEGGAELRLDGGHSLRVIAGYGHIIGGSLRCTQPGTDGCDDKGLASKLPYFAAAYGMAF
jgi:hypothetical protein